MYFFEAFKNIASDRISYLSILIDPEHISAVMDKHKKKVVVYFGQFYVFKSPFFT